jgi:hypothetical protein
MKRDALFVAYRTWAGGVTGPRPPDADEIESGFDDWCEAAEGESPLARAVKESGYQASQRIAASVRKSLLASNQHLHRKVS